MTSFVRPLLIGVYEWLTHADAVTRADLIFCLAGRQHRKKHALALFLHELAPQVLLSVGRYEIRRLTDLAAPPHPDLVKLAAGIVPRERHFFLWFGFGTNRVDRITKKRLGTLSEICALKDWLTDHQEVKTVLMISCPVHLRRLRLCCRLLPASLQVRFIGSREPSLDGVRDWWCERQTRAMVFSELLKILLYRVVLALPITSHIMFRERRVRLDLTDAEATSTSGMGA